MQGFMKGIKINTLYRQRCQETLSNMPDSFIDLTVTSPPYGYLRDYNGTLEWNFEIFKEIAELLYQKTKKGGVVVWVVADQTTNGSESLDSFRQALYFREIGFYMHDTEFYRKINYVPLTHRRCEQAVEYMFILSKGAPKTFNPIMVDCKQAGKVEDFGVKRRINYGKHHSMRVYKKNTFVATRKLKIHPNIFTYKLGQQKTGHPAAFPDELARDQIFKWSNPGDLVYDPFCGSGTTPKMAILQDRDWIGSECVPEYCDIAQNRIDDAYKLKRQGELF